MPVSWIEHCGKNILYVDYRSLGQPECVDTLHDHSNAISAAPERVLILVDARGVTFGGDFMRVAKAAAPRNTEKSLRRAVVGADGVKEMLLAFFNVAAAPVPMTPFATLDQALAYLTDP